MEGGLLTFVFDGASSERLDKALAGLLAKASRSYIKTCITRGAVSINGKTATKAGQKVKRGDTVEVEASVEVNPGDAIRKQEMFELQGNADVTLDILYEDDEVVVLCKPKGLVMHPSRENGRNFDDSLCSGLIARYGLDGLSPSDDGLRPGIVHRLDVETSGVVVCARTGDALAHLQRQFAEGKAAMERSYEALCAGSFGRTELREGILQTGIGRHPKHGTRRCVRDVGDGVHVKSAETHWKVEADLADGRVARVQCRLATGRTHQIRVHMKHVHHPLLCDPLYGPGNMPCASLEGPLNAILARHGVAGQFLHARTLSFVHPRTLERMSFEAPLPPYWLEAIAFLES